MPHHQNRTHHNHGDRPGHPHHHHHRLNTSDFGGERNNRTGKGIHFIHPGTEDRVDIVHLPQYIKNPYLRESPYAQEIANSIQGREAALEPEPIWLGGGHRPVVTSETLESDKPVFWGGGHGPIVQREAMIIKDRHDGQHNKTRLVEHEKFNATSYKPVPRMPTGSSQPAGAPGSSQRYHIKETKGRKQHKTTTALEIIESFLALEETLKRVKDAWKRV
ncbi:hypothetical protein B0J14DRAFT_568074 [Halenospora varia]|nr:hypothetical protein B0J14DRAFT_568074 [Halenospora varia]